jgi:hypothetical protein
MQHLFPVHDANLSAVRFSRKWAVTCRGSTGRAIISHCSSSGCWPPVGGGGRWNQQAISSIIHIQLVYT